MLIKCISKIDYFGIHSDVRRDYNMTGHILSKLAKDLNPDNVGLKALIKLLELMITAK